MRAVSAFTSLATQAAKLEQRDRVQVRSVLSVMHRWLMGCMPCRLQGVSLNKAQVYLLRCQSEPLQGQVSHAFLPLRRQT